MKWTNKRQESSEKSMQRLGGANTNPKGVVLVVSSGAKYDSSLTLDPISCASQFFINGEGLYYVCGWIGIA